MNDPDSSPIDPRVTPARRDLAADHLRALVAADHYAAGAPFQVRAAIAPIHAQPADTAEQWNALLAGDLFTVYEQCGEWAWGQSARDFYVGWVRLATLAADIRKLTHRIACARTLLFSRPDLKSPARNWLSCNAGVTITDLDGNFAHAAELGWIYHPHLVEAHITQSDPIDIAGWFDNATYRWGGIDSLGLDCSGLVQMAFWACGVLLPRDTDMQAQTVGIDITESALSAHAELQGLARGDLVFWRGHVGLMVDDDQLIHANAHHMRVARESVRAAQARIAPKGGSITRILRPDLERLRQFGQIRPPGAK